LMVSAFLILAKARIELIHALRIQQTCVVGDPSRRRRRYGNLFRERGRANDN
jgi:hypothetical protein